MIYNDVIKIKSFHHSWLITGFVTRVTLQMPHVEQEQLTPVFFVDFAFRDLLFSILCFVDRYLSIWPLCRLSFCELRLLISSLVSSICPHKTLRWKLKIEQHKILPKNKVPVPLVASVVLLMLETGGKSSTRNGSDRNYDKRNISAALEFTVIFRIFNNEHK